MRKVCVAIFAVLFVVGIVTPTAMALDEFKKEFAAKYVQGANDEKFTKLVKTNGCFVCHARGAKKEVRNVYGEELAKLIDGSAKLRMDAAKKAGANAEAAEMNKLLQELNAAFTKVEGMKSPAGETYGDRLKEHKLPAP
jgi:hypothetical protein